MTELVYGKKPDLKVLREWGDEVLVHQAGGNKLGRRAKQGCWIGYNSESNGSLIYFSDTGTIKAERNFCFVNNGRSGLEGEKIPTGKSQSSSRPAESPSKILKAPNSISSMPAPLPNTVFNPIIENEKPNNATHDCKTDDLPEASVTLGGRPKHILNPSLKAYKILKGKAVVLAEDLDWAEVHVITAEIEEMETLEPSNLKEAMRRTDWELWKKVMEEELTMLNNTGT